MHLATAALASSLSRIIYVDPVDFERRLILNACAARGIECVQVWSPPYATKLVQEGLIPQDTAVALGAPDAGDELEWSEAAADGAEILGVLCGSDAGLATAERLQHVLLPRRSNGINLARRDKYQMSEVLRASGLNAARQCAATKWNEALPFLDSLQKPLRVVVKPRRGQDSLRVGLATTLAQAQAMFNALLAESVSLDDEVPAAPLLQEFLEGDEWVIDSVSRDGEHKVLALWRYEKEEANGAPFVYTYMELQSTAGELSRVPSHRRLYLTVPYLPILPITQASSSARSPTTHVPVWTH